MVQLADNLSEGALSLASHIFELLFIEGCHTKKFKRYQEEMVGTSTW